jgi:arsenite methyltransferase
MTDQAQQLREQVRDRYAAAARAASTGGSASCCSGESCSTDLTGGLYDEAERSSLPQEAVLASLGCGNPLAVAELGAGETVLDLGSGGGIDVLLSARRVGPAGKVYGLDMTEEMLALALANAAKAGATNVEFLKGHIESIPLPANRVDVVISNCVINLSVDKPAVFAEMFRVLAPGGRLGISDVVAEDHLTPADRAERGDYVGCIAGALSFTEYRDGLIEAGFTDVEITPTHQAAEGMHSAIVRAVKSVDAPVRLELPLAAAEPGGCCD